MFGKGKKTVSLEYKNKLLAEIEYYDKRIAETLERNNSKSFSSFDDVHCSNEDDSNPYTLNIKQPISKLKRQEASLESRVSMTLELALLTIMHSDNANIMTEPPVVRRPVNEDGTWLEVTADCKIDLVAFVITFYAHKPFRKQAPTRYRNINVKLKKPAHEKELSQSILSKLNRPNLALQVLQSYAAAFRSRRTTLLELAQKYADQIRMEEMAGGGYRVRFLEILTVDWSLENMWSPVVPFCHRMKFELEYMPKKYVHTIGRLYKQFKDPSLETPERTRVLGQIFDTCLSAQAPAKDLQESAESDPDTAGLLHERRTTIDQEPEVPSSYQSPKKSKGKENKAQNKKTAMEPPKKIPKKVKKNKPPSEGESNAKKSRLNDVEGTVDSTIAKAADENGSDTVAKKNNPNDKEDVVESRKGVKRRNENGANSHAKKIRAEEVDTSNSSGEKGNTKEAKNLESNPKKDKVAKANVDTNKKDLKSASESNLRNDKVLKENTAKTNVAKARTKSYTENSKATKQTVANVEENAELKKTPNTKDQSETTDVTNSGKNDTNVIKATKSSNNVKNKVVDKEVNTKKKDDVNTKVAKNKNVVKENVEKNATRVVTRKSNIIDKTDTVDKNKNKESNETDKNDAEKENAKSLADSAKITKEKDITKNAKKVGEKDPNKVTNMVKSNVNAKKNGAKNITKTKEPSNVVENVGGDINFNKNAEITKQTVDKNTKSKNYNGTFTKATDKTFTKTDESNKNQVNKETTQKTVKNNLNAKSDGKLTNTKVKKNDVKDLLAKKQSTKPLSGNINKENNKQVAENNGPKFNKTKENTKVLSKESKSNEAKTTSQSNTKTTNIINDTNTNTTEKGVVQKFTENQSKIAAKLKSKIPMMKRKIKISALTNKLDALQKNATKSTEKNKVPLKSLPVFKKPSRISPRKLPSFKPPKGVSKFTNK